MLSKIKVTFVMLFCALMVGCEMCSLSAALRRPPSLATTQK